MRISSYEFGRIVVDAKTYTSDVIIYPDRVEDKWWRAEGHRLDIADLEHVWDARPERLVVGTGRYGRMAVPEETRTQVAARGIEMDAVPTGDAVALFNKLAAKPGKRVVAAFHLTC